MSHQTDPGRQSYPIADGPYLLASSRQPQNPITKSLSLPAFQTPSLSYSPATSQVAEASTSSTSVPQVTKPKPAKRRGRSPYRWSASVLRKVDRVRQLLGISFDENAKALQNAGGPGDQTTRKAVKDYITDDTPAQGLLRNPKGKERRAEYLKSEAERRHNASNRIKGASHRAQGEGNEPGAKRVAQGENSATGNTAQSSTLQGHLGLEGHEPTSQALLLGPTSETTRQSKRGRSELEEDAAGATRGEKQARETSPGKTAAEIDTNAYVDSIVSRHPSKSRKVVDYIVHHLSATFSSDSTNSIKEFLSSHGSVRNSWRSSLVKSHADASSEAPTICLRLLPYLTRDRPHYDGPIAARDVHELITVSGANVCATLQDGITPLHLAVSLGYLAACGVLLWAGADPHAKTKAGVDIPQYAEKSWKAFPRLSATKRHSRILKCVNLVCFELDESDPATRHHLLALFELCNRLDPDPTRRDERERDLHKRQRHMTDVPVSHNTSTLAQSTVELKTQEQLNLHQPLLRDNADATTGTIPGPHGAWATSFDPAIKPAWVDMEGLNKDGVELLRSKNEHDHQVSHHVNTVAEHHSLDPRMYAAAAPMATRQDVSNVSTLLPAASSSTLRGDAGYGGYDLYGASQRYDHAQRYSVDWANGSKLGVRYPLEQPVGSPTEYRHTPGEQLASPFDYIGQHPSNLEGALGFSSADVSSPDVLTPLSAPTRFGPQSTDQSTAQQRMLALHTTPQVPPSLFRLDNAASYRPHEIQPAITCPERLGEQGGSGQEETFIAEFVADTKSMATLPSPPVSVDEQGDVAALVAHWEKVRAQADAQIQRLRGITPSKPLMPGK